MQFIAHKRKLPLAFANPLEAAIPAKEEGGGTLMMGKYWKRKMDGILAEYKKWRIFYKEKKFDIFIIISFLYVDLCFYTVQITMCFNQNFTFQSVQLMYFITIFPPAASHPVVVCSRC